MDSSRYFEARGDDIDLVASLSPPVDCSLINVFEIRVLNVEVARIFTITKRALYATDCSNSRVGSSKCILCAIPDRIPFGAACRKVRTFIGIDCRPVTTSESIDDSVKCQVFQDKRCILLNPRHAVEFVHV